MARPENSSGFFNSLIPSGFLLAGLILPQTRVKALVDPAPSNIFHGLMAFGRRDCPLSGGPWSDAHLSEFMGLWRRGRGLIK